MKTLLLAVLLAGVDAFVGPRHSLRFKTWETQRSYKMSDDETVQNAAAAEDTATEAQAVWTNVARRTLRERETLDTMAHLVKIDDVTGGFDVPSEHRYVIVRSLGTGLDLRRVVVYEAPYAPNDPSSKENAEMDLILASCPGVQVQKLPPTHI